jgi:hypothetical protein
MLFCANKYLAETYARIRPACASAYIRILWFILPRFPLALSGRGVLHALPATRLFISLGDRVTETLISWQLVL